MQIEKLVKNEELMNIDDKEDEINEDKEFCMLCAKYRNKKEFVSVGMGPILMMVCKKCNVTLHNLNLILTRAGERLIKTAEEAFKKEKDLIELPEKKIITFPS